MQSLEYCEHEAEAQQHEQTAAVSTAPAEEAPEQSTAPAKEAPQHATAVSTAPAKEAPTSSPSKIDAVTPTSAQQHEQTTVMAEQQAKAVSTAPVEEAPEQSKAPAKEAPQHATAASTAPAKEAPASSPSKIDAVTTTVAQSHEQTTELTEQQEKAEKQEDAPSSPSKIDAVTTTLAQQHEQTAGMVEQHATAVSTALVEEAPEQSTAPAKEALAVSTAPAKEAPASSPSKIDAVTTTVAQSHEQTTELTEQQEKAEKQEDAPSSPSKIDAVTTTLAQQHEQTAGMVEQHATAVSTALVEEAPEQSTAPAKEALAVSTVPAKEAPASSPSKIDAVTTTVAQPHEQTTELTEQQEKAEKQEDAPSSPSKIDAVTTTLAQQHEQTAGMVEQHATAVSTAPVEEAPEQSKAPAKEAPQHATAVSTAPAKEAPASSPSKIDAVTTAQPHEQTTELTERQEKAEKQEDAPSSPSKIDAVPTALAQQHEQTTGMVEQHAKAVSTAPVEEAPEQSKAPAKEAPQHPTTVAQQEPSATEGQMTAIEHRQQQLLLQLEKRLAETEARLAAAEACRQQQQDMTRKTPEDDSDIEIVSVVEAPKRKVAKVKHEQSELQRGIKRELPDTDLLLERSPKHIKQEIGTEASETETQGVDVASSSSNVSVNESVNQSPASKEAEEETGNSNEQIPCIMLQDEQWQRLLSNKTDCLIRTYPLKESAEKCFEVLTLNAATTGCLHVGRVEVSNVAQVTRKNQLDKHVQAEKRMLMARMDAKKEVFSWKVSTVNVLSTPTNVRFTTNKFRPKHFYCSKADLADGILWQVPRPSLYETPKFFMKLLSSKRYNCLAATAKALDKKSLRVGTACSGTDICVVGIKALISQINKEFNAT